MAWIGNIGNGETRASLPVGRSCGGREKEADHELHFLVPRPRMLRHLDVRSPTVCDPPIREYTLPHLVSQLCLRIMYLCPRLRFPTILTACSFADRAPNMEETPGAAISSNRAQLMVGGINETKPAWRQGRRVRGFASPPAGQAALKPSSVRVR
jgi:hypothetical protein